jgi:hypothetical protein
MGMFLFSAVKRAKKALLRPQPQAVECICRRYRPVPSSLNTSNVHNATTLMHVATAVQRRVSLCPGAVLT